MVVTKNILPPEIKESFDHYLLGRPAPKFCDDEEDILNILNFVKEKLWNKLNKCPAKKLQCERLEKEIRDKYEQIKKKKESQGETKNITQRPFYYFNCSKRSYREILQRYKYTSRAYLSSNRSNDEI